MAVFWDDFFLLWVAEAVYCLDAECIVSFVQPFVFWHV